MKKNKELWVILLFLIWIGLFFAANLFAPQTEFSERENRYLQTRPKLSVSALRSGEFMQDFEEFCSDQFVLRDRWVTVKARCELFSGKKENNGIFLCEGERLIKPFTAPTDCTLSERAEAVTELAANLDVPVYLALIPDAAEIYGDLLPEGAPNDSEAEIIRKVCADAEAGNIDILSALTEHRDEEIFYRTDHHWTSLGAHYAGEAVCEAMGAESAKLTDLQPVTVSDSFYGTAFSSSGYTWIRPDSIQRFTDGSGITADRYDSSEPTAGGLYAEERLALKDKYTYFLGGNAPRVVIHGTETEKPVLLILRDSYADSLVPFLTPSYSEIHLLDLRYYLDSVKEYVTENKIDTVLVLYSVSNFCTDKGVLMMAE